MYIHTYIVELQLLNHRWINILFSCYFHTVSKIKKIEKKKQHKKYIFVYNAYARE